MYLLLRCGKQYWFFFLKSVLKMGLFFFLNLSSKLVTDNFLFLFYFMVRMLFFIFPFYPHWASKVLHFLFLFDCVFDVIIIKTIISVSNISLPFCWCGCCCVNSVYFCFKKKGGSCSIAYVPMYAYKIEGNSINGPLSAWFYEW